MKRIGVALLLCSVLSSVAHAGKTVNELKQVSKNLPLVELPVKAAEIISQSSSEDRERLAVRVVRVFLVGHHSLAPSLVGAICHQVPELSTVVVAEAVRLFPEITHSIVKAAVVSAPDYATAICLQAALEEPGQKRAVVNALLRGNPAGVTEFQSVLQSLVDGRAESVSDALYTTKNRIGTSARNTPANPLDSRDNNPPGTPQLRFQEASIEIPEDYSGSELTNFFDTLLRELIKGEGTHFDDDVVIERYVQ